MQRPRPRSRTRLVRAALAAVAACGLVVAALPGAGAGASVSGQSSSAKCPLSALDKADGTVDITMWHSTVRENAATLQALADTFNSSQDKVNVTLVAQPTYQDTLEKYVAGLSTGDLPDLAMIGDGDVQQMIDTHRRA
jgi:sn-glycerol 3-phosphate transport system substrate-binding protein